MATQRAKSVEFIGGPRDGERHRIPTPLPPVWFFTRRTDLPGGEAVPPAHASIGLHEYRLEERFAEDVYVYLEAE